MLSAVSSCLEATLTTNVVCGVVGDREAAAVETVEGGERGQRKPLVAIDAGVVSCQ